MQVVQHLSPLPPEAAVGVYPIVVDALGRLLRAEPQALDAAIENVLAQIGTLAGACRSYVFLQDGQTWSNTHEWCAAGVEPVKEMMQDVPLAESEPVPDIMGSGRILQIDAVAQLPDGPLRALLEAQGIRALLIVPLSRDGAFRGLVGFDRVLRDGAFSAADLWLLRTMSDGLMSAIARQRAEAALQEARSEQAETLDRLQARVEENAMLGEVVRRMQSAAAVTDADLRARWVNPALEARLGASLADVRDMKIEDFLLSPEVGHEEGQRLLAALHRREPVRTELPRRDAAGRTYWVDVDFQPLHASDGRFEGYLILSVDITERKRKDAELERLAQKAAEAHARLDQAIEALQDGFVLFDSDSRLVLCNARYREFNAEIADILKPGVTLAEIIRTGNERGMYDSPAEELESYRQKMLESLRHDLFEFELPYRDGRTIRVHTKRLPDGGHVGLRIDITAIREAERRLNAIIDGARIGTSELDLETYLEEVNDCWAEILGFEPGSITRVDKALWDSLVHPEDHERVMEGVRRIEQGAAEALEAEFRMRHQKGHWVHVLARSRVSRRDAEGRPTRVSGVMIDITEQRTAEERLHRILGATAVGVWELNNVTGAVAVDDQYAATLGYTPAELGPMTHARFESMVHPEDLPKLHANVEAHYGSGQRSVSHEYRMRHRDGHWVWVLSKAQVTDWAAPGKPAAESGVMLDITEHKLREFALARAKEALEQALAARQEAEQRFADIAAVSDDWFWEQDAELRFTYVSSGFERATGMKPAAILGRTRHQVNAGAAARQSADWSELARATAARESYADFIYRIGDDAHGRPIWIRVSGAPFFAPDGTFQGYRGVGSNVSALVAATERAEAASRAKSRFLANMSHELRTPLTGVLGMAELLGETAIDSAQQRMIDTIRDSGEGLLAILNDILDLAKIEAGKLELERHPFTPTDLAGRVEALYEAQAKARGLALSVTACAQSAATRMGDRNRILQILNNLLGNALKFTEEGSVAVAVAIRPKDILEIRVTDTGIGMSAAQCARVFEEFEQAEGSTARRFGGTGLGLSITRRLVQLMAGDIALQSAPGRGTTVSVRIPAPPAAPDAACLPAPAADLRDLRVLVADDNRTNRRILHGMLRGLGLRVTLAKDGRAVLDAFRPGTFDLLLLDIAMPELDGIGALARIRACECAAGAAPVPAIAVTANAMKHQVEEYLAAGFAGHVAKPFRKAALAEAIARHVTPRLGASA